MRRSLGKAGMGGGGMLGTVGRAVGGVGGGIQEGLSAGKTKSAGHLSISSPSSSPSPSSWLNLPVSTTSTVSNWRASTRSYEVDDWELFEEFGGEESEGSSERFVFGPVPTKDEVEQAVSSLQQVVVPFVNSKVTEDGLPATFNNGTDDKRANAYDLMRRVSSVETESDWIEPVLNLYNPRALQSEGYNNVFEAFRLLQTNPSVQRMVASLSSDKAVWDAVMKNEAVRELKETFYAAKNGAQESDEGSEAATRIMGWILDSTKAKIKEVMDKIMKLVTDLFQPLDEEIKDATFEDMVRSSLMLSVMVLLVVVVTRIERA